MDASQLALNFYLTLIFTLPGNQPLLTFPLFPDALILTLAVEPLCQLLGFAFVVLFLLGSELL